MARQMKDSGIEWIGEIPEAWGQIRLKYCCSVLNGFPFDSKNFSLTEGFPLIRIRDITSGCTETRYNGHFDNAFVVTNGDLLVGMDGEFNIRLWDNGEALLNQRCCKLVEKQGITRQFLFYYLPFRLKWVNDLTYATTVKHLSSGDIVETALFVPSIAEQHRIAAFLDRKCAEIDAVIGRTKATIEEYKKLKQAVITEAVTKGVRGARKMKESGIEWIGEIPEEWDVVKATRLIVSTQNGLTRRDLDKSDGHIVLKLKNITASGQLDYSEINRIQLTDKELETYQLSDGDFLFVRVNGSKNLVGKCAIYHDNSEPIAYNDHIIRVRLNDWCDKRYFQWFLLSDSGKVEIDLHTSTAAGQYTISGDGLRDLHIVLPPTEEQAEVVEHLNASAERIDTLIAKKTALLTELETYKKSLIYEYVTGKKEVPYAKEAY